MKVITQIYVFVLAEGTDVWRPVQAIYEHDNVYRIISPNPDPEDEQWQFSAGDLVRCKSLRFSGGEVGLVAYSKAEGDAHGSSLPSLK